MLTFRFLRGQSKAVVASFNFKQVKSVDMSYRYSSTLIPYEPPEWLAAAGLEGIPKHRVHLAHGNTPIHKWDLSGLGDLSEFQISIKRDDMTGSTLSGNKVRKLEFLMACALEDGYRHVITCGGIQSNHCRATAVAARQLGLKPHLVLRSDTKDVDEVGCHGNLLLNRLCGAELYLVPKGSPYETHLKPRMEHIARDIESRTGEKAYLIPVGGSNPTGLFGYLTGFNELVTQGVLENFDDIVFACGSGGTASGLAIGNYLTGSKLKIHGVCVSDNSDYFYEHIQETLDAVGLGKIKARDAIDIVEGYKGQGYGISVQEELEFIVNVSVSTGIMLDPVYTGKGVRGMVLELQKTPSRFQGKRILFLHTGGVYGMYDGRLDKVLREMPSTNTIHMWPDVDTPPSGM